MIDMELYQPDRLVRNSRTELIEKMVDLKLHLAIKDLKGQRPARHELDLVEAIKYRMERMK